MFNPRNLMVVSNNTLGECTCPSCGAEHDELTVPFAVAHVDKEGQAFPCHQCIVKSDQGKDLKRMLNLWDDFYNSVAAGLGLSKVAQADEEF